MFTHPVLNRDDRENTAPGLFVRRCVTVFFRTLKHLKTLDWILIVFDSQTKSDVYVREGFGVNLQNC